VDADVVVIGAGALGLSTALHCAMAGRSVAVMERRTAPPKPPGRRAPGKGACSGGSARGPGCADPLKISRRPSWAAVPRARAASSRVAAAARAAAAAAGSWSIRADCPLPS